jgi:UDP-N-acetyl-D-glucosamine dehydrogenase
MEERVLLVDLEERIKTRSAQIAVVGLGYAGLPLALSFARTGFDVSGIDLDESKVASLNAGHSYISDVSDADLAPYIADWDGGSPQPAIPSGRLRATADYAVLTSADAVIICVPTPLSKTKDPDLSYIISAADQIALYVHPEQLVVLESTTYPGTTDEIILPRLAGNGLTVGQDFFLAFSPERIDPGNTTWHIDNTPKVIGGVTPRCIEVATRLYEAIVPQVVPVSSTRAAEMVKLLENTFRAVNIGLVNEVALMCHRLGIDVWEVIDAASTKPFGFMPFYPGPGLGGHCIPIDPHYLAWKLRTLNYNARFIELAADINFGMPGYVASKIQDALNDAGKAVKGARVVILGVAYKRDVGDVRESPAIDIIRLLRAKGADLAYHDPYVPHLVHEEIDLRSVAFNAEVITAADCVVVVTDHHWYDWAWLAQHARLIVDTRNVLRGVPVPAQVVKL